MGDFGSIDEVIEFAHTKISFNHRKDISDYSDLVEMLFPGNRNEQHTAACIFFELKWTNNMVPNDYLQDSNRLAQQMWYLAVESARKPIMILI